MKSQRSRYGLRTHKLHCGVVILGGGFILSFGQTVSRAQEQPTPAPAAQAQVITSTTPAPDPNLSDPEDSE